MSSESKIVRQPSTEIFGVFLKLFVISKDIIDNPEKFTGNESRSRVIRIGSKMNK